MKYEIVEKNLGLMIVLIILIISGGFLVEVVFLFFFKEINELVEGFEFYFVLELEGWDIYICEGCYVCYIQQICLFWVEIECYGYYFVVGEFVYDCLFLWGLKCIGLDLVCVGGWYFDVWQCQYLYDLCSVVFEFNMLVFFWLFENWVDYI